MRTLDLELLRSFHNVARLGSISAAAAVRHQTVSALSLQMRRLETALNRSLLHRNTRGVTLTPEGERLLRESRGLLAQHDALLERLGGRRLTGRVRLGLPEEYVRQLLFGVLPVFNSAYPDVTLEVNTATSGRLAQQLSNGELDMAIVFDHVHSLAGGRPLWRSLPAWVGAESTRLTARQSLPLALHPEDCPWRVLGLSTLEACQRPWHAVLTSPSMSAIESAVLADVAISVLDRRWLKPGMRLLDRELALPELPACEVRLFRNTATEADTDTLNILEEQLVQHLSVPICSKR